MKFDLDDMTIGEIILFEETTGRTLADIGKNPGGKDLQALVFIVLRRTNPAATLEDASSVRLSDLGDADVDPTEAAAPIS